MSSNDKQMQKVMWNIIAHSPNSRLAKLFTQVPIHANVLADYQRRIGKSQHPSVS
jgi:hypothetical protein